MIRYIVRRLLWLAFVLFVISVLTFLIFFVMPPSDPAVNFAGRAPREETITAVREQFGLDRPVPVQYGLFVKRFFLGDEYGWPGFGFSFTTRTPIRDSLLPRAWVTAQLAIGASIVWLVVGVPIGIVSALKRHTMVDRAAMGFALFGVSAPVFWLGLVSLFIFWQKLGISPGTGYVAFSSDPVGWATHFWLPWVVLALLYAAFYARIVRGNMLEVMAEDYIRTARAKGLSERRVVFKHGLRSSLTPIVTLYGLDLGLLLGGAIVTESVFNIPGLGPYTISAVFRGDLPVVVAVTIFGAFAVVLLTLIVDIVYAYLDPRVRYT